MKYFGGCDVGSTYAKCVILDENGKMVANATVRSKINPVQSAELALGEAIGKVDGINSAEDLSYLIGTGYGRNKVPFADENISEISCHAMGVHVTNPAVKAIIDIGGQDVKGIAIDTDGTVKNFAMNDKCAAGTGRFFEAMANAFEMSSTFFTDFLSSPFIGSSKINTCGFSITACASLNFCFIPTEYFPTFLFLSSYKSNCFKTSIISASEIFF